MQGENLHHVFWERRAYKTPIEKLARNLGGLVIRVDIDNHNELHAVLPPPPKPPHEVLSDLVVYMREVGAGKDTLEGLEAASTWFDRMGLDDIANNLEWQHYYLSGEYND